MVSILGNYNYTFPKSFELSRRLKDVLETEVEEKYYLSNDKVKRFKTNCVKVEKEVNDENIIQIANIVNTGNFSNPQRGRIYSANGICPSLNTVGGGGLEPKIVEPIIKRKDIKFNVRVRKYPVDCEKLCELLREHKTFSNKEIADRLNVSVAKVEHWFRKDDSFAIPGEDIWMELKNLLGITTDKFDKSIMTFEEKENVFEKAERCYETDGIAPTITSATAAEKIIEPVICASRGRNPENPNDRTPGMSTEQRIEVNDSGVSNCLTTVQKDNLVLEPQVINPLKGKTGNGWHYEQQIYDTTGIARSVKAGGGSGNIPKILEEKETESYTIVGSTQKNAAVSKNGVCPTLAQAMGSGGGQVPMHNCDLRIRKLTPKECWRLMDFNDEDFEKAQEVNSNTQLYKQAGNSIVVNCLAAIFGQLFDGKEKIYKDVNYNG